MHTPDRVLSLCRGWFLPGRATTLSLKETDCYSQVEGSRVLPAVADVTCKDTDMMSFFGWGTRKTPGPAARSSASRHGVEPTTESGWQRLREPPRPQDLVLSALAQRWCESLQPRFRPSQLCALFPRLANRLALCWNDEALASRILDDLVVDKRRNRTGFPPEVSQELIRLRLLRPSRPGSSGFTPLWDASNMAVCDR